MNSPHELATFAGGCFWCMVKPFDQYPGVISITSGFTGGHVADPTYEAISTGLTGHYEAVQIVYDPRLITYNQLLNIFWQQIDPTDLEGQFADRGAPYRTAIFYHTPQQQEAAEESRRILDQSHRFDDPIVTIIAPATTFYPAEDAHQDYYKKNPDHYQEYERSLGRDAFLDDHWGKSR